MRFDQFLKIACPPLGLQWRKYRRAAARHGVDRRLQELGLADYPGYLEYLQQTPEEAAGLAEHMRVTVSRFFRERERWELLASQVLPQLLNEKAAGEALRVWSAGCCGGEEPYTLALLFLAYLDSSPIDPMPLILATDIDKTSLERAALACYGPGSLREIPRALRRRYFVRRGELFCLSDEVLPLVHFAHHHLMDTPLPHRMDLVCCRYLVFTYYRGARRRAAARRLWQALRPGGALMIARKEDLGLETDLFTPWPEAPGVFRRLDGMPGDDIG